MSEEKKMMSVDEMEDAAGGKNHGYGFGFYMTVTDCNGTYLALRNATVYDRNNELAQLYPGYSVFTSGAGQTQASWPDSLKPLCFRLPDSPIISPFGQQNGKPVRFYSGWSILRPLFFLYLKTNFSYNGRKETAGLYLFGAV